MKFPKNTALSKKEKRKKSRERFLSRGFCEKCPTPRMINSNTACETHWFTKRASRLINKLNGADRPKGLLVEIGQRLKEKLEEQKYTCPYTGILLIPGKNASVDHIIPRIKRPDLAGDLNNIEWVDDLVNRSKNDLTKSGFIALCREIVNYTKSE